MLLNQVVVARVAKIELINFVELRNTSISMTIFDSFLLNFVLGFFQTFQLLSLSILEILTRIKLCHIPKLIRNLSLYLFCVTLPDSVYNKQILTRQDPDIVFINLQLFWYHTAHSLEDSLVRAIIPKLMNKTDIKILQCNTLYLLTTIIKVEYQTRKIS